MQALTLGRTTNNPKALSMFLVETRCQQSGRLNGIELVKLKNKLGSRQLPTAELILDGCRARIISEEGKGVATISNMLNITRLHNVISSVAIQRKVLNLARDYSHRRIGKSSLLGMIPIFIFIILMHGLPVLCSYFSFWKANCSTPITSWHITKNGN